MTIRPDLALVILSALVNAAVTWGVVSTKLAWLRRDIDYAHARIDAITRAPVLFPSTQAEKG